MVDVLATAEAVRAHSVMQQYTVEVLLYNNLPLPTCAAVLPAVGLLWRRSRTENLRSRSVPPYYDISALVLYLVLRCAHGQVVLVVVCP